MKITMILVIVSLLSASAFAGRGNHQHKRIKQGEQSGSLTTEESQKLKAEQKEIRADKQEAMADGTVSKEEHKKLRHERHKASKHIYKSKHDNDSAPSGIVEENNMNIPVDSTTSTPTK